LANQKKICLLGEFAVGKTSLVRRFVEGRFDERYLSTIGVKISRKLLERETGSLSLILWDLAGGEDFMRLTPSYLRGAAGAVLVFDLLRVETIEACLQYAEALREHNSGAVFVIAANKVDLEEQRKVSEEAIEALSDTLKAPWVYTSAKDGRNVEAAFELLADRLEEVQ
jgi:small GTP-binding protein